MSKATTTLAQICDDLSDGLHKAPIFNPHGEYLFVNATNLENGFIVDKDDDKRADYSQYAKYGIKLNENTILYSIDGTIGNIARYRGEKCILGKGACYLKVKSSVNVDYIYYLLQSNNFKGYIKSMATGSTIHHISLETIRNYSFVLPPYQRQQNISAVLKAIDERISNNTCICAELESMAKTLYDYWFVQFDFPDEDGKPYCSSGGKMVWIDQLKRKIPKSWKAGQLCDIANIVMGQSPVGESYNEKGEGIIFYQGRTDFGMRFPTPRVYTTAPTRFAKKGDILLSVRAPVGDLNIAMEDCCVGRGLAALSSKIGSQLHLLYTLSGNKQLFDVLDGNGTTFGSITKDTLFTMRVVIPKMPQLKAFEEKVSPIEQKIRSCESENRELTKLRDWLLPMLMNGQATVEDAVDSADKMIPLKKEDYYDQRFALWLKNQGLAARGEIDRKTLREIFNVMDDDDK